MERSVKVNRSESRFLGAARRDARKRMIRDESQKEGIHRASSINIVSKSYPRGLCRVSRR